MSSNNRIFRTARLSDRQILSLVNELSKNFEDTADSFRLTKGVNVSRDEIEKWLSEDPLASNLAAAEVNFKPGKFHISISRGTSNSETDIHTRIASPYFDEVILQTPQNRGQGQKAPTNDELLTAISIIQKSIQSLPFDSESTATEPKDLLTNQIAGISRLHEKLISDAIDLRTELEKERTSLKKQNDDELKALKEEIESQLKTKRDELETEKKSLEEYRKSIDDRAYTFARRSDRERITDAIQSRLSGPGLSRTTLNQRRNVHRILGGLFSILAIAAIWTGYELYELNSVSTSYWVTLGRLTLLTSVSIGIAIYSIQWARRIYFEDAKAERELERYSYDLNRASWAIETILEAKKENGEIPPETWILGVCNNLFGPSESDSSEDTAMDAFTDLLKVAAKAQVGTDGASLEFTNAGAKKIAKSQDG